MLNVIPLIEKSLVNSAIAVGYRGKLKESFLNVFISQWCMCNDKRHERTLIKQVDQFNWQLHVDLRSIASMLAVSTGLLERNFYTRITFTRKDVEKRFMTWNLISESHGNGDATVVNYRLYQHSDNSRQMAVVFQTTVGLIGVALWSFDLLEIFSEEHQSEFTSLTKSLN